MSSNWRRCARCFDVFEDSPGLQLKARILLHEEGAAAAEEFVEDSLRELHEDHINGDDTTMKESA